jgi:hypothetical protein
MRLLLALAPLSLAFLNVAEARTSTATRVAMLPARLIQCTIGHALNVDPHRYQTIGDIKYEGAHRFAILLPPVPQDRGPPPDPTDDPEPVDPAVQVVDDPDGIAGDMLQPFLRVVDRWPERVEMIGRVDGQSVVRLIVISEIDTAKGTADLYTTRAADAASPDLENIYQGGCRVKTLSDHN